MGHKSLGLLGLGQKSLEQSRDSEIWDSSPWDKNPWDWQSRPMPILDQVVYRLAVLVKILYSDEPYIPDTKG